MRVLWFSVTPSLYGANSVKHNGGGWISSLEEMLHNVPDVALGVVFEHTDKCFRQERNGVTYYPINVWKSPFHKLYYNYIKGTEELYIIPACLKAINDFKPDVIHVFGSEWCFGLITQWTNIPVVIHMQGSMPAYYNARFPAGYSTADIFFNNGLSISKVFIQLLKNRYMKLRAIREAKILKNCSNFMGRTEWDKNMTRLYSPMSNYYYCSEALRDAFLNSTDLWMPHNRKKIIVVSTISVPLYKGTDLILKTAETLKNIVKIDFEWHVFGVKDVKFHERKTKIKASNVNVILRGVLSAEQLKDELVNADVFVHPSYIDNSPNSVCEAQLLGLPIVSTNVGGISSLIKHCETGVLVPVNDPFTTSSYIMKIISDNDFAQRISGNARAEALRRHDKQNIKSDLIRIYKTLT